MKAGLISESCKNLGKIDTLNALRAVAQECYALPATGSLTMDNRVHAAPSVKVA
tara:strand:- start:831 stop:992 length:162 start_codon:yes stop_codon:yes gene_type:complete